MATAPEDEIATIQDAQGRPHLLSTVQRVLEAMRTIAGQGVALTVHGACPLCGVPGFVSYDHDERATRITVKHGTYCLLPIAVTMFPEEIR